MNPLQRKLLAYFKDKTYPLNPLLLCETLGEEPYIVRRNVFYLVQHGFLEHHGYQTRINRMLPLYRITEKGRKAFVMERE